MDTFTGSRAIVVIGRGRLGTALAGALRGAGLRVDGPLGRGADAAGAGLVLLCVPDAEIAVAAAAVAPRGGLLVGHCSGATGLAVLAPHEAFSLHPLMTVPREGARFAGAGCAIAGVTPRALRAAEGLADALGMVSARVDEADRAAYHAAASIASNFLVTLEAAAERLAGSAGVPRELLAPLVRATVENWAAGGAQRALTGPIARGDEATVARQREAVAGARPRAARAVRRPRGGDARAGRGVRNPAPGARHTARHARHTARHARRSAVMRTVRSVAEVREALRPARRQERSIGLVPTMGALHDGHLSLIRAARERCDVVVVSLFVNPSQFDDAADLDAYPRDEARDAELAAEAGADLLFAPPPEAVYPPGFATTVRVAGLTEPLEGEHRGTAHFDAVATVVTKLLNMVGPQVAFFGQKDAQQALVVRRLVADLDMPVRIEIGPTVREADGLALSSRNAHLRGADRERALALRRALEAAEAAVAAGERDAAAVEHAAREAMVPFAVEPEYLALVHPDTLAPVTTLNGETLLAVAARVGPTRLIDNTLLRSH